MWIDVNDRTPVQHEKVLFVEYGVVSIGYMIGSKWWDCVAVDHDGDPTYSPCVTHWSPLPDPPTAENGAEPVQTHNSPITQ